MTSEKKERDMKSYAAEGDWSCSFSRGMSWLIKVISLQRNWRETYDRFENIS